MSEELDKARAWLREFLFPHTIEGIEALVRAVIANPLPKDGAGKPVNSREEITRAILTAVLPLVLADSRKALEGALGCDLRPIVRKDVEATLTRIEALLKDESRGTEDG